MKVLLFIGYSLFVFATWCMLKAASDADDTMEQLMNQDNNNNKNN